MAIELEWDRDVWCMYLKVGELEQGRFYTHYSLQLFCLIIGDDK